MWVIGRFLLGCDHGLFLGYLRREASRSASAMTTNG
jgi:hypothetical protein